MKVAIICALLYLLSFGGVQSKLLGFSFGESSSSILYRKKGEKSLMNNVKDKNMGNCSNFDDYLFVSRYFMYPIQGWKMSGSAGSGAARKFSRVIFRRKV